MREQGVNLTSFEIRRWLVGATILCVALFLFGAIRNHSMTHWYLLWNLALAWVPLILSSVLVQLLAKHRWSEWGLLLITFAWLFFLHAD